MFSMIVSYGTDIRQAKEENTFATVRYPYFFQSKTPSTHKEKPIGKRVTM